MSHIHRGLPRPEGLPPTEGALLKLLLPYDLSLGGPQLRLHDLNGGAILWNAGDEIREIFFPLSGMIAIRVPLADGHAIEIATIWTGGSCWAW
jgi:hypothetical protein